MKRTLHFSQSVNAPVSDLRRFFGDVNNLPRLTPPFPAVSLVGPVGAVAPGASFRLRLSAGPLAVTWLTRIDEVRADGSFVDSFEGGPFRSWRHTHDFESAGDGTIVRDRVDMEPVWWCAPVAPVLVRGLFWYRRRALGRIFP